MQIIIIKFVITKFVITKFVIPKLVITKFVITNFVTTKYLYNNCVVTKLGTASTGNFLSGKRETLRNVAKLNRISGLPRKLQHQTS
jgi:hypothetical protein